MSELLFLRLAFLHGKGYQRQNPYTPPIVIHTCYTANSVQEKNAFSFSAIDSSTKRKKKESSTFITFLYGTFKRVNFGTSLKSSID